jgi:hypothetical protein
MDAIYAVEHSESPGMPLSQHRAPLYFPVCSKASACLTPFPERSCRSALPFAMAALYDRQFSRVKKKADFLLLCVS